MLNCRWCFAMRGKRRNIMLPAGFIFAPRCLKAASERSMRGVNGLCGRLAKRQRDSASLLVKSEI